MKRPDVEEEMTLLKTLELKFAAKSKFKILVIWNSFSKDIASECDHFISQVT